MSVQVIEQWTSLPCQKLPLTTALLAQACPLVPFAPVECREALVMGMWFPLHLGEIVLNKESFNTQRHLNSSSVMVTTNQGSGLVLELQLVNNKMDPLGSGQVRAVASVCPQVPQACATVRPSVAFLNHPARVWFTAHEGTQSTTFGRLPPVVPLF